MGKSNSNIIFYTCLSLGLLIRILIIFLPPEISMTRWGSDDMFYYSQIAGHFAENGMLSFDGINPGSGVQPLFFFILIPFAKWILNEFENSVIILFVLISLLNIATAFMIKRGVFELSNDSLLAAISASIFILHPKIISVCFQGTEAALSLFILTILYFSWERLFIRQKRIYICSILFALCIMTRLDFCILLFGLSIIALGRRRTSILNLVKVAIIPIIALCLWLAFIHHQTGSYIPDSGAAKKLHTGFIFEQEFEGQLGPKVYQLARNFAQALVLPFRAERELSLMTFIILVIGGYQFWKQRKFNIPDRIKTAFLPFLGAGIFALFVLILTLAYFREWYVMPLFLLFVIGFSEVLFFLITQFKLSNFVLPILILLVIGWWIEANVFSRSHLKSGHYAAMEWTKENIETGTHIGAFNSGFYGSYLGSEFPVTNLDGIVNHKAYESLKNKTLSRYVQEHQIEIIIDYPESILFYSNLAADQLMDKLELLEEFEIRGSQTPKLGIYKVGN